MPNSDCANQPHRLTPIGEVLWRNGVIHVPTPMLHSWAMLLDAGRVEQVAAEMRLYLPDVPR